MKLVSRYTDYAMRALVYLSGQKDRLTPVPELVKNLRIPRPCLRRLLQMLKARGLLISRKGLNGGFKLAVGPDEVSLIDVMRIFQGPFKLNECIFKRDICPRIKYCRLNKKLRAIEEYVGAQLGSITLSDLTGGRMRYGKKKHHQD